MINHLSGWDDTIVALATPPGIGAIGVIRLSGKQTFPIVDSLFPSKDLLQEAANTLHVGYLKHKDQIIDEVVVSLFRSPRSYTGEDVIEISCHGSPFIHQRIIEACIESGARLAKPGEFTQRAFLNGKLDLAQAEAVADVIASNTEASHKAAFNTMRGGFSSKLKELREQLIRFSALIELELDFSQEDVEFADRSAFYELIRQLQFSTDQLVNSFQLGNVIKNGVSVAIVGKPNAGKSTLLNALLNENRAIVSDIPGTTRDTIEETINIDGILFRLIDTAGIRQHTADIIESAGVERSLEKMKQADLVIYLFDAGEKMPEVGSRKSELDKQQLKYLLVANKIDEVGEEQVRQELSGIEKIIFISARQNKHIEVLKEKMVDAVLQGQVQTENVIVTNARHYHALKEAAKSLYDIKTGLDNKLPGDLLALDIRRCLHYLGEITGQVSNEDMLDFIFSKFCIGK
ncbi:tRNA uridine-5-carboxymethylaminomethyl(34) synthesis GTPase MnmE [Terrimonas pollutisoli]|uniref:tRNA uridine-5-carboxymethylaminomethyl(34) synthesis GTPase MnmE n=1 Tax=Terrimonas pollutisoli TaxID=3034147 RepID=UPI0023ED08A4|nr:tRNA uridine-5-carboxymethylaminomethyl(34) synthesis GTPase MnmE [Terrimonas sp. H1YJ31]